jgi:hypothetical protein
MGMLHIDQDLLFAEIFVELLDGFDAEGVLPFE